MADQSVVSSVRRYLRALGERGITARSAVLFGSHARGEANEWSDIDLVVVAGRFDAGIARQDVDLLWRVAAATDSRIEPVPCGERQWFDDDTSVILEMARREGLMITADAA